MSRAPSDTSTVLRTRYQSARAMDLEAQTRDCIDYLQNPEVLVAELADAYLAIDLAYTPPPPRKDGKDDSTDMGAFLVPQAALSVVDPLLETEIQCVTCLASKYAPLRRGRSTGLDLQGGLDYLGLSRGDPTGPVLGVVQSQRDATPYVLVLRLLSCLAELAPPAQLEYLDRTLFKGSLGQEPLFDLHLVLRERSLADSTLGQLTQDLCDVLDSELQLEPSFPEVLGGVLCVDIDGTEPGTASFNWRI